MPVPDTHLSHTSIHEGGQAVLFGDFVTRLNRGGEPYHHLMVWPASNVSTKRTKAKQFYWGQWRFDIVCGVSLSPFELDGGQAVLLGTMAL